MDEIKTVSFQSKLIKTDVTAVKILQCDHLLIGIGGTALLYELSNQQFLGKKDVFIGQKIYGFVPNPDNECNVAVYGGKLVKICCIKTPVHSDFDKEQPIRYYDGIHNFKCNDWILSLIWKKTRDIIVLTAHNVIQVWSTTSSGVMVIYKCDEKCILYSGYLTELNDGILVMGGTVFSQVVLWNSQSSQVQQRVIGHKGVIFSVFYCTEKNLIITTSDDRSIRIWSVANRSHDDSKTASYWTNAQIDPLATLFGHTARVMRGIIVGDLIVSIGEDGLMCTWTLTGDLMRKTRIHQGGCLWAMDSDKNKNIVVTGGSDSGVLIHRIEKSITNIIALNSPDGKSACKKVVLTTRSNIVCYTEGGGIFYFDMELNQWDLKHQITYAKSCHILSISLCRKLICVAGINGNITILEETPKCNLELVCELVIEGKLLSLHWIYDRILITCNEHGILTLWSCKEKFCSKLVEYCLPASKERWLTVAAINPLTKQLLIVGDRCGNIHLFKNNCKLPIQTLQKVHGRLGVNEIKFDKEYVVTTGRDGSVKYFHLSDESNEETPHLEYYHNIKVPFDWVEKFIDNDTQIVCGFHETNLVVWSMKKHSYILDINCGGGHRSWDLIKNISNKRQNLLQFVFIKNFKVHILTEDFHENDCHVIEEGFHVKEINDLQSLEYSVDNLKYSVIISAGEDTAIRISLSQINGNKFTFDELFKVTKHASSIRCLSLQNIRSDSNNDNLRESILFSGGGRAQICVWKLTIKLADKKPVVELKELLNYMLKGTDLERKKNIAFTNNVDMSGETRFMSFNCISDDLEFFNVYDKDSINYVLSAGCSDGVLRIYSMLYSNKTNCALKLRKSIIYHKKCILKVSSFVFEKRTILLSMSVDGMLIFWDLKQILTENEEDIKPFHQIKIHKAGINSFDMSFITDDKIIIATGGDDNCIYLNIFSILLNGKSHKLKMENICEWRSTNTHCAQITGLKLINDYLITTSIDQRLTVLQWRYITNHKEELQCEHIGQYHSSISDVQGLNVCNFDRNKLSVFIFGKGIEVLNLELPQGSPSQLLL